MFKHLLVPTDGTYLSTDTISRAVAFARSLGARITFFHASPDHTASLLGDGALLASIAPDLYADRFGGEAHSIFAKARFEASTAGVECDVRSVISDHPHEAILKAAEDLACDLIFMASHGPRSIGGVMLGSETLKVLAHTRIPVLVSSIERNASAPTMNKALSIIRDEHRSLAAVIKALEFLLEELRGGRAQPDFKVLRAIIHYIRVFPAKRHHFNEESQLFPKLLARTHEFDGTIAELQHQHAQDGALVDAIDRALGRYEAGDTGALEEMTKAVGVFAGVQFEHIALEENVLLPAARMNLLEHDWVEIAAAFAQNHDPGFGADTGDRFARLFSRIIHLVHPDEHTAT